MNYDAKLILFVTIGFLIFCLLCGVLNTVRTWYRRRVTPLFEGPALLQRDPDGEPVCLHCGWPLSSTPPGMNCTPSIHAEEP